MKLPAHSRAVMALPASRSCSVNIFEEWGQNSVLLTLLGSLELPVKQIQIGFVVSIGGECIRQVQIQLSATLGLLAVCLNTYLIKLVQILN